MTLISVIISTFNSSEFIIETLESIAKQSWNEIELIITDDCSTDNTLDICKFWLNENKQRFVRTAIITSKINTGISANANRGLRSATGEWIKFLGADDTLREDCISDNMGWISSHPAVKVLFSQVDIYHCNFTPDKLVVTTEDDSSYPNSIMAPGRSAISQYKMLLVSDRIHYTPSVFLSRNAILSVGGFDERFKLQEDYPLWLNLTKNGYTLYFMNKVTVNYRMHYKAQNNTGIPYLINPNYFKTEYFRKLYTYPFIPTDLKYYQRFNWYASQVFRVRLLNRKNKPNKFLLDIVTVYLNPFMYLIWIKKGLNKSSKNNEFYI